MTKQEYYENIHLAEELYHHGVLGMKWGVRRYQNADGSLTAKGRERMAEVASSDFKRSLDTSRAKRILVNKAKMSDKYSTMYSKKSVKELKRAEKFAKGTSDYKNKISKSKEYEKLSKEYSAAAKVGYKKLNEINQGTLKAGRDFIVQKDLNVRVLNILTAKDIIKTAKNKDPNSFTYNNPYLGSVDEKIIYNKKNTNRRPLSCQMK